MQQAICQAFSRPESSAICGERIEILLQSQQGKSTGARTLKLDGCGNSKFKHAPSSSSPSCVSGSAENSSQSPQGSPVTIFRALPLLPLALVTQTVSEPF